jgi:hypothetical protein
MVEKPNSAELLKEWMKEYEVRIRELQSVEDLQIAARTLDALIQDGSAGLETVLAELEAR